jgi:uncharacterized caspase-like protein/ABC-type branched-subunit amino acid transport system substrate-binding protein
MELKMKKIALLIGVSEYRTGFTPLPSALKDVDAMYSVLVDKERGEFLEEHIICLKNPDRQSMEDAIHRLFNDRQKDDLVLFYFSGHGIKDIKNKLYLGTNITEKDSNGSLIPTSAVDATTLHDRMEMSKSQRKVIILDSCYSGAIVQGMTAKDDGTVRLENYLGGEGRAILTSSTATEYSFGAEVTKHGNTGLSIYTRYLVEGIKTGAADQDGDGLISVEELYEYTAKKVKNAAPAMNPEFYPVRQGYKIFIAKSRLNDPKLEYEREFQRQIERSRGSLSIISRRMLTRKQQELKISAEEVNAIEDRVLQPYIEYKEKIAEYEKTIIEQKQIEYPFSNQVQTDLKEYQQQLNLRDEDVFDIHKRVEGPDKFDYTKLITQVKYLLQKGLLYSSPILLVCLSWWIWLQFWKSTTKLTTIADLCSSYDNEYISCGNAAWNGKNAAWNGKIIKNNEGIQASILGGKLADNQVYVIAVVVPDENSPDFITQHMLQGIADSQEDFNNKSSNSWKIFVLIARESKNSLDNTQHEIPDGGSSRADELVKQPRILGVIGPYSSPSLVNVVNKYCNDNLTLLSPTVGIPIDNLQQTFTKYSFGTSLNKECFFRTTGTNRDASLKLLDYINKKPYQNLLVLMDNGDAFAESFWKDFKQQPNFGNLSHTVEIAPLLPKQVKSKIDKWKEKYDLVADKTAILMIKGPKNNKDDKITKAVISANGGKFLILATNPVYQPSLLHNLQRENSAKIINKMIIAVPWFPTEKDVLKVGKPIDELDSFYAMSKDAMGLLIQAISKDKNGKEPTRKGVKSQFSNLGEIHGLTGNLTLNNSDRAHPPYNLIQPNCQDNNNCKWTIVK